MNIKDMTEEEIKAYETLHGCKLRREPREAEPAATNPHSLAIAAKVNETAKALMTSPSPEQIRLHADIKVLKRTNQSLLERNDTLDAKVDAAENQRVMLMKIIDELKVQSQPSTSSESPASE